MPAAATGRQLALDLGHAESFARDDFLEGPSNAAALATIERWPDWPAPVLALVGPEGAGKSHLAAIWAEQAGARFLSGRALREASLPTAIATGALVIEDLASGQFDERALFHLLNLAAEQGASVLLTARTAPSGWTLSLPDLASRLRAAPLLSVDPPNDPLLRAVLVKLLADRQLQADETLVAYLLPRLERSFAAAKHAVARLDSEALRRHRPVTRALAAELFQSLS
jgi:chromosomal replication initiation ATPase DnaA